MEDKRKEFTLSDDMRADLDQANGWVKDATSALGLAYLEHEEARARFEHAQKNLNATTVTAREAEIQHGHVLKKMAAMLNLGEGQWVYDGAGKLVRKDIPNAKSS